MRILREGDWSLNARDLSLNARGWPALAIVVLCILGVCQIAESIGRLL